MCEYYNIFFHEQFDFKDPEGSANKKILPFQDSDLFVGRIKHAKLLTQNIHPRAYQLTISLPGDCSRIYRAGDTIGILPKNDEKEVREILDRLNLSDKIDHAVEIKGPKIPAHVPDNGRTLKDIFTNNLDIRSIPSKLFLKSLTSQTDDPTEIERLNDICKARNSEKYSEFVNNDGKTLLGILKSFPRCQLSLSTLIKFLPSLKPRPYSISSACRSNELNITFSVRNGSEKGVCSGFLEEYCRNFSGVPQPEIQFYFRKPTDFRLPDDPKQSIIMIATGAGIAPFVGFLEERACAQSGGGVYLYYGCRHERRDFLYKAELEKYRDKEVLTELYTSFSRDGPEKDYIQNRIKESWDKLYKLLNCEGACIYVCGDAKTMMTDIRRTFVDLLCDSAGFSERKQAEDLLKAMENNKKYIEDKWA